MATCLESINSTPNNSIETLFPNTITPFAVDNINNKLFKFDATSTVTKKFDINLSPLSGSTIRVTMTIYRIEGSSIQTVGTVNLTDPYTSFSRDFNNGSYIICFRAVLGSFTGTIISNEVRFPVTQTFSPNFYFGSTATAEIYQEPVGNPCDEPLFFEILEGKLPPGLNMNALGIISGKLPNLDCIMDTEDLSPSVNWYNQDIDGSYQPWGYRWRFKVKVSLASFSSVSKEEWFCVQVHNNWSFDRDNFLEQAPFERTRTVEIIEQPKRLPPTVCFVPCDDDPETVIFVPEPIQEVCSTCEKSQPVEVILLPIPDLMNKKTVSEIAQWYINYQDTIFGSEELNRFAESLKQTKAWQAFLENENITSSDTVNNTQVVNVSTNNNTLEIIVSSQLKDSSHLDVMMDQLREIQNQTLPITAISGFGETMTFTITTVS